MLIKFKDNSINIPSLLMFAGLLIVDNMYANHCKKKVKSYEYLVAKLKKESDDYEEEES